MNPLARKALLFALFSLLLGGETAYFGRECAVEFLKQAIAIDPGSYDARFLLGLLALNPGASGYREQCASLAPGTAR